MTRNNEKVVLYKCGYIPGVTEPNDYYGIEPAVSNSLAMWGEEEVGLKIIKYFDSWHEAIDFADENGLFFTPDAVEIGLYNKNEFK